MKIEGETMLLKVKEVAEKLRVSEETVREWAKNKVIPSVKIGATLRFREEEIKRIVNG